MTSNKLWTDLFNNDKKLQINVETKTKSDLMIIDDIIKSNYNGIYFREKKIPQSIIKKSIKDAYKKY
jgi:hypothetical protein